MKSSKDLSSLSSIVFSTNPDYKPEVEEKEVVSVAYSKQKLRIHLERHKGNKMSTNIIGFEVSESELTDLAKALKTACGVGGSSKNDEIILQGDQRDKALRFLVEKGFTASKKAGG